MDKQKEKERELYNSYSLLNYCFYVFIVLLIALLVYFSN